MRQNKIDFLLTKLQYQFSMKEKISFSCQCYKPFFSIIDTLAKYIKAFVNIFSWVLYWNVLRMNDINSSADECIRNKIDFQLTKLQYQFSLKEIISFSCQCYKPFFCIIDAWAKYIKSFVNIFSWVLYWNALQMNEII